MSGDVKNRGLWGESVARAHLESRGLRFMEFGYTTRFGEIDLIMRDGDIVVFVEVKLRRNRDFAEAREFVTQAKRKRLRTTAQIWLNAHDADERCRFDVVEVYASDGVRTERPEVVHIPDAFE
ncbi:MAG: YraN family protein [Oscillospiraceae bacterium]|jgi:putative endonuclease|nr:YraN family protein [Oscillospiraceae bacterium]